MNPRTPTPPRVLTSVREVQGGQGGKGEEGRLGPQKPGLQKQVDKVATGQAADPGSPKGSQEVPVPALTSVVPWKNVLFLSSLFWLSMPEAPPPLSMCPSQPLGWKHELSRVNSPLNCVTLWPASSGANNMNRCGSCNSIPWPESHRTA